MKVLVTGASGFTGSCVVPLLLRQGLQVRCLTRPSSQIGQFSGHPIEWVQGDLGDPASLSQALEGVDALVNLASLGFGHAPNIVNAARAADVPRAIFMSTTAIFTQLNAPSKAVRLAAEDTICQSGLAYTILRPTMIYGNRRDRNMCRLIDYLQRWPVIPILGHGEYLQQPVYVGDVAQAVVNVLGKGQTVGQAYNIPGANALTYNQVIESICVLLQRSVRKLYLPSRRIVAVLQAVEHLRLRLPIKAEQILRLNEHKAFDFSAAARDFDYQPRCFAEGIRLELEEMGLV